MRFFLRFVLASSLASSVGCAGQNTAGPLDGATIDPTLTSADAAPNDDASADDAAPPDATAPPDAAPRDAAADGGDAVAADAADTTDATPLPGLDAGSNAPDAASDATVVVAPPTTPAITGTNPISPASTAHPFVLGTTTADAAVAIYASPTCGGIPLAIGAADATGAFAVRVDVPDGTTTLSARASFGAIASACSAATTFVADTVAPTKGTVVDGPAAERSAQTDATSVDGHWSGFTDGSSGAAGIAGYEWNLSTSTACAGDVVGATAVGLDTQIHRGGLALAAATYYQCVRAKDAVGNASAWATSPGFAVYTPATVASITPKKNATGVARDANVVVVFSKPIDASTLGGVTLTCAGKAVTTTGAVSGGTVTLTPSTPYAMTTACTLAVPTTVKDTAGHPIAAASTSSFTVADGAFGAVVAPVLPASHVTTGLRAAVDPLGASAATWLTDGAVWSGNLATNGTWSHVARVDASTETEGTPTIAAGAAGTWHVVWDSSGTNHRVWDVAVGTAGPATPIPIDAWSTPGISALPSLPQIALDGRGGALAIWSNGSAIRGADLGATWSTPVTVGPSAAVAPSLVPAVTIGPDGNGYAVWTSREGGGPGDEPLTWNRHDPIAGWQGARPVDLGRPGGQSLVGFDPSASAMGVFWIDAMPFVGEPGTLFGSPLAPTMHEQTISTNAVVDACAGVAPNGDALALVETFEVSGVRAQTVLYWTRRTAGSWSALARLTTSSDAETSPSIAVDAQGAAVAAWVDVPAGGTTSGARVFVARYRPATGWSAPQRADAAEVQQTTPNVSATALGDATTTWIAPGTTTPVRALPFH